MAVKKYCKHYSFRQVAKGASLPLVKQYSRPESGFQTQNSMILRQELRRRQEL